MRRVVMASHRTSTSFEAMGRKTLPLLGAATGLRFNKPKYVDSTNEPVNMFLSKNVPGAFAYRCLSSLWTLLFSAGYLSPGLVVASFHCSCIGWSGNSGFRVVPMDDKAKGRQKVLNGAQNKEDVATISR